MLAAMALSALSRLHPTQKHKQQFAQLIASIDALAASLEGAPGCVDTWTGK